MTESGNNAIRKIIISTASVSVLAGTTSGYVDGIGTNARFTYPLGIAISPDGVYALVTERTNQAIRKIIISLY